MAKLPALIAKLAPFDGRSTETLAHVARFIRERGFMTTTKRGVGAAHMTSRDAANLLIALNGAEVPKDAPSAIEYYRALSCWTRSNAQPGYPDAIYEALNAHTFGEALEKLIELVPELVKTFWSKYELSVSNNLDASDDDENHGTEKDFLLTLLSMDYGVEVRFEKKTAIIELYEKDEADDREVKIFGYFDMEIGRPRAMYERKWADRQVVVSIGLLTLMAVWFALHPNEQIGTISESTHEWITSVRR